MNFWCLWPVFLSYLNKDAISFIEAGIPWSGNKFVFASLVSSVRRTKRGRRRIDRMIKSRKGRGKHQGRNRGYLNHKQEIGRRNKDVMICKCLKEVRIIVNKEKCFGERK